MLSTLAEAGFHVYVYGGVPEAILINTLPSLAPLQLIESTILATGRLLPSITVIESVMVHIPSSVSVIVQM